MTSSNAWCPGRPSPDTADRCSSRAPGKRSRRRRRCEHQRLGRQRDVAEIVAAIDERALKDRAADQTAGAVEGVCDEAQLGAGVLRRDYDREASFSVGVAVDREAPVSSAAVATSSERPHEST